MLRKLPRSKLQELIGEETLESIVKIIPHIPNSGVELADEIYNDKALLIKIFDSFSGKDSMYSPKFRETLYGCFSLEEIDEMCNLVGISTDEDFKTKVNKLAKLPWKNNANTQKLIQYLGLPESYIPPVTETIPNVECICKPDVPFKSLLDFQTDICNRAVKTLSNPYSHFIIKMPTGSGKTRTTMEIITKELNAHPDRSVIWLAHSEELCEQAVQCFKEVWEHVGRFDIDVMRVWGNNSLHELQRTSFIVAGLQKFYSLISNKKNNEIYGELVQKISKNISLIVVDEAHKSIAPTYKKVIDTLSSQFNNVRIIGLTATPGRGSINSDSAETEELLEYYNNEILEIDSGESSVFSYLRNRKILAKMDYDPLKTDLIFRLTEQEKRAVEKFYDYPEGFLERISTDSTRNLEIILKLKKVCEEKKKTIFFAGSLEHSKFICAVLIFLGFKAEHIDGSTKRERRAEIISDFKEGKLDVICNYGVLTTGFDAPNTDVVFIARPTLSVVLYSQMIGRGLRGPAIGGTEKCTIIDVIDNIENYASPDICYEYFKEYGV